MAPHETLLLELVLHIGCPLSRLWWQREERDSTNTYQPPAQEDVSGERDAGTGASHQAFYHFTWQEGSSCGGGSLTDPGC